MADPIHPETTRPNNGTPFNIFIVAQNGRLAHEALLFAASLRHTNPGFNGRLIIGEPQPGPQWQRDPRITNQTLRSLLTDDFGAEIVPFDTPHFGEAYPYGNKIEGLTCLPEGEPFVFFDTDTLITAPLSEIPFDFDRPSASMRREGTWPKIELYGPGHTETWRALYDKFGLEFDTSLDLSWPDEYWQRYLYFNAGWFFYKCPRVFGRRFLDTALAIRDDAPAELICQPLDPWLDQVALPLVIHGLNGGRHTIPDGMLDGTHSCHYRLMPLLYARESDAVVRLVDEIAAPNRVKKVLKGYEPMLRMIYQQKGAKARALFDRNALPRREQAIRNRLRRNNLWLR